MPTGKMFLAINKIKKTPIVILMLALLISNQMVSAQVIYKK